MRSLKTIVVAGAAGFVGSALVRRLLTSEGVEKVIALDLLAEAEGLHSLTGLHQDPRFGYLCADIRDEGLIRDLLRDLEATGVFNLTEQRQSSVALDTNITGTSALLRVCREAGVPLLQASTDAVYGHVPSPERATEEWPVNPGTTYAASKAAAELLCFAAAREFSQDVVITRAATTYGPRLPQDHRLTAFIAAALRGGPIPLPGNGMQIRDWLHVDDHATGLIEAFRRAKAGEPFNLGGRYERTFLGIARSVLKTLSQPENLIVSGPPPSHMDARRATDATKINRYTGWIPRQDFKSAFPTVVRETAANLSHAAAKPR